MYRRWLNNSFLQFLALSALLGLSILLRMRGAILRLTPDASYDIFSEARNQPFSSIFSFADGYLSLLPRMMAHVIVIAPIEYTAMFSIFFTSLFWILAGAIVAYCVKSELNNIYWATIAALMVVLAPGARESSLGNIGNVRWQMFIMLAVAGSSFAFVAKFPKTFVCIALITGLSHPLAVLAIVPILISLLNPEYRSQKGRLVALIIVGITFLIQVAVFLRIGRGAIRAGITHWWSNPPIFWWFNWLAPLALAVFVVVVALVVKRLRDAVSTMAISLAITSFAIGSVSWIQGGIADRYFVVPTVLSWCALVVLFVGIQKVSPKLFGLVFYTITAVFFIACFKWFGPSSYLNSGPTWMSEVERLRVVCKEEPTEIVQATLSAGIAEIRCENLTD
jgi:hypothetical protein